MRKNSKQNAINKNRSNTAALVEAGHHALAVNDSYINELPLSSVRAKLAIPVGLLALAIAMVLLTLAWWLLPSSGTASTKADASLLAELTRGLVAEQLGVDVTSSGGHGDYQSVVTGSLSSTQLYRRVNQVIELQGSAGIDTTAIITPPTSIAPVAPAPASRSTSVNNPMTVSQLLGAADRALVRDHLTTPLDNNAYSSYRSVLAYEPNNRRALAGIEKIQQRYLGFVVKKLQANALGDLLPLVQKAKAVGVTEAELELVVAKAKTDAQRQKLTEVIQIATQTTAQITAPVGNSITTSIPASEQQLSIGTSNNSQSPSPQLPTSQLSLPTNSSSKLQQVPVSHAELAFQQQDQALVLQVQEWLANGQVDVALAQLTAFVNKYPAARVSLVQLFNLYLQQDRLDDARHLINQATHLPGHQFSYLVAEILIRRQDVAGALRALESQQPVLNDVPAYYALQAALLYQQGDYQQSATLYQQLLAAASATPQYWFGLAINLDNLGQSDEALAAFAQVDRLADVNSQYAVYARQRLAGLAFVK